MGTFFARRYMRKLEWVGRFERRLGALVILLLIAILATFAVIVRTDRNYLFEIDPAADIDHTSNRDLAVAQRMLPPLPHTLWSTAENIEIGRSDRLAELLGDDRYPFAAFGVRSVYRRRYCADQEPTNQATILTCDAGTPAQAFGLCIARRPAAWDPLTLSRNAWSAPAQRRVGFWQGRYYTELTASAEGPEVFAALIGVAQELSALQLDYGDSFWAERMLPPQGRVPDSLRYVHHSAFGVDGLNEVFLVDFENGATAWVSEAGSASGPLERVKAVVARATKPQDADGYDGSDSGQARAIRYDGPLTIVPWNDGEMALFTSSRYAFGVYGPSTAGIADMAKNLYANVGPAAATTSTMAFDSANASGGTRDAGMPFPSIDVTGWQKPRKVSRFTAQTLYQKINGRADAYLQFHVVGLDFGTYAHERDPGRSIDVYKYDMGEPVNALGIYQLEAPPDPNLVSIGDAGYETGGAVFFRKASSYVQILPTGETEPGAAIALTIARRMADQIKSTDGDLWAREKLPKAGRVPQSFSYIAQDAFGLDFLSHVFTAAYNHPNGLMTLFIHRADDEASARALLDQYRGFMDKYGRVLSRGADETDTLVTGEVAGLIDVVFVKGRYLGGVAGAKQAAGAQEMCQAFYEGLSIP